MTNLQQKISPIQLADYARVVEVWEASVRATHHFVSEEDIQFFKPLVRDSLNPAHYSGVRDSAGVVVGFMAVSAGSLDALFIHPDWRGQGIGRRLVRHSIDTLNVDRVDVNEQNEQAIGFYVKMGFEVASRDELDGLGKPYPILHMRLAASSGGA